ncbi:glycosyltransferase [Fodinibius sediminis]|uniref:Glycosyltransferase, GT2 family n=1 Tax=Fodinibius sediminis TaxID=1214077 RepID=A0A521AN39_9BACT|nr:glycosyltransferase [Fodinibius sediminis]SMO36060.1 Glycosyltransferase, GT2 family [Fodinibius sediminis]
MSNTPLLTVTLVVQDQKDVIENTLTSLYECGDISFELFVIDDASSDGSDEVIQSVLDYYQHEQTFYYEHGQRSGRGHALNEALLQSNGSLFWAPETISEINESQLVASLNRLEGAREPGIVQRHELPADQSGWLGLVKRNQWPTDGAFIWNLEQLPGVRRYFNPFLDSYGAMELAERMTGIPFLFSDQPWSRPSPMEDIPPPSSALRQEMLFTLLRKLKGAGSKRNTILKALQSLETQEPPLSERDFEIEMLNKAVALKKDGRFNAALELIEEVLEDRPSHPAAKQLKIQLLEKKRRFVEASELKHEVNKKVLSEQKKDEEHAESGEGETSGDIEPAEITLIIPTAVHGKGALEHCLLSVSEHCNLSGVELIVIDNASLDDTHDYLQELQEKQFLRCRVITNRQNRGFAASVNQGLEKAETPYACIMHNDVEFSSDGLGQLKKIMEAHPEYALVGPAADKTYNPDQSTRNIDSEGPGLVPAEYIDSFCMMLRTDTGLRMDEHYELAFFEDIDLCFQARTAGHKVGIAPHVQVTHHLGTTTFPLDLDTESRQYWKNVSYFNEKWGIEKFSEQELKALSNFDQLLALDELVNPLFPEEEIKAQFARLFTDEMRTEIFNSEHDPETLCRLVHLFMVMNKRDILRRFEDRLEGIELPATLIYQLVRFYFDRNIYSRCLYYLDQLESPNESLRADLYRLAIYIENKNFEEAIPLLRHLLDQAPANPTLYKLAGDIHKFNGNEEEAASFHRLAGQINPFKFDETPTDAFGFER